LRSLTGVIARASCAALAFAPSLMEDEFALVRTWLLAL